MSETPLHKHSTQVKHILTADQVPRYVKLYTAFQQNKEVQSNPALRWYHISSFPFHLYTLIRCPNANCNTIVHRDQNRSRKPTEIELKVRPFAFTALIEV